MLNEPRKIRHNENVLLFIIPAKGEHFAILGIQKLQLPAAESPVTRPERQQAPHPPEKRMGIVVLGLHVNGLVVVLGIDDDRKIQLLGIRPGKACVAIGAPLHRSSNAVPIAQINVFTHPDFVAVVNHRSPGQRKEQGVHQLDSPPVVPQQRRKTAADSEVDLGLRVVRINTIHVVPFLVGHHFQGELVVVPQEQGPLG